MPGDLTIILITHYLLQSKQVFIYITLQRPRYVLPLSIVNATEHGEKTKVRPIKLHN